MKLLHSDYSNNWLNVRGEAESYLAGFVVRSVSVLELDPHEQMRAAANELRAWALRSCRKVEPVRKKEEVARCRRL